VEAQRAAGGVMDRVAAPAGARHAEHLHGARAALDERDPLPRLRPVGVAERARAAVAADAAEHHRRGLRPGVIE
jgi:hypothetical protein